MSEGPTAAGAAQRVGSGTTRLARAWRALPHESRLAAFASLALFVTLFLPWYQVTLIAQAKTTKLQSASATITGWGAFSFVEAAVLLVAAGVVTLLFQRAEGRAFHLPGGDGGVITAAGVWTCVLIVWRIFDKQGATTNGPSATTSGIEWGIFIALAAGAFLAYSGSRIRAAHRPEPPLPGEDRPPAGSSAATTTVLTSRSESAATDRPRRRARPPIPTGPAPAGPVRPPRSRPPIPCRLSPPPRDLAGPPPPPNCSSASSPTILRRCRSGGPSARTSTSRFAGRRRSAPTSQLKIPFAGSEDETLALGEDATIPLGEDATVPLGEDATVPLGDDDTLPLERGSAGAVATTIHGCLSTWSPAMRESPRQRRPDARRPGRAGLRASTILQLPRREAAERAPAAAARRSRTNTRRGTPRACGRPEPATRSPAW